MFASVASLPISTVRSASKRHPGGQGASTWRNRGPSTAEARFAFLTKSYGKATFAVAA